MTSPAAPATPLELDLRRAPWETYRWLRDNQPVLAHPNGTFLVTRYEDVVAGFKDHDRLSSRIMEDSHSVVFGPSLTAMDGEEHTQKRNIIAPEFVGKKLDAVLPIIEQNVRALITRFTEKAARELIEGFAGAGRVELVDQFSTRLPVNVILDMLALPKEDHDFFHDCYSAFMAGLGPDPVRRAHGVEMNRRFHAYIDPYVQARKANPGEDLISRLCAAEVDGQSLSDWDIKSFVSLLLTAGGETTDKAIANLWWLLLSHPEQFAEVVRDPSLLDQAFCETMRHSGPVGAEPREVTEPFTWHGVEIPEKAIVMLSMHSANRDERVFREPDRFDIFRDDLYTGRDHRIGFREDGRSSHIGFGLGKHFCVGYQLARSEAVIGSRMLLEAMRDIEFAPGEQSRIGESPIMYSVTKLPLTFTPA
jgi:pulcherriminic acid synthase